VAIFEGEVLADAHRIMGRYPPDRPRSAVMPLLYLAQSIEGHVSRAALREVGELIDVTTAEVEAVATFYTMLRVEETGTHLIAVCTNLSCALRGAKGVYEAANRATGVSHGSHVSEDGMFSVHEEECLGACEFAPVVQVNVANHDLVTPERVVGIVDQLREGHVPAPARGAPVASFKEASRILAGLQSLPAEVDA
jgi:NADH-quinone oxidoreductase subunit E